MSIQHLLHLLGYETLKFGKQKYHDFTKEEALEIFDKIKLIDCNIYNKKFL